MDQLLKDDDIAIKISEADNDKFHQMNDNNQSSEMYNLYNQDGEEEDEIAHDDEATENCNQSSNLMSPHEYGDEYMNIQEKNILDPDQLKRQQNAYINQIGSNVESH